MGKITYYIDGNELASTYGVHVSASKGLIGRPERKAPASVDYASEHGIRVDLSAPRYKAREITLSCFVHADSRDIMAGKINAFLSHIDMPGLHRMEVALDGRKSLFFEVYRDDSAYVNSDWSCARSIGTFSIKLVEPHPLKAVYGIGAAEGDVAEFSLIAEQPVNIYWGDGTCDTDATSGRISHEFARSAEYIVMAGAVQGTQLSSADIDIVTIHSEI